VRTRDRTQAWLRELRPFLGTLVAVPVIVVLFGSHWTWERSAWPARAWRIDPGPGPRGQERTEEVRLHFYEDGSDPRRGVELGERSFVRVELSREVTRFVVVLQAEQNDRFLVSGGPRPDGLQPLWQVPRRRRRTALETHRSPVLEVAAPVRFLEVHALRGIGGRSVSGLRLELEPLEIRHVALVPGLWGAWVLLRTARRRARWAGWILERWRSADLWLAAALIAAIVLRVPEVVAYVGLAVVAIWMALRLLTLWLARSPRSLAAAAIVAGLLALTAPPVFEAALTTRIAQLHDLTVDHRPRPGGEINEDRIRFDGVARDLTDDDFVVMFLGDSFTHGVNLRYDETYPSAFERFVAGYDCSASVRAVNAGWTSASPLLALRLVREIGPKYRPDLLIYNLDMTDFHDDLLYEARLREGGDLEVDLGEAFLQILARTLPGLFQHLPRPAQVRSLLRSSGKGSAKEGEAPLPRDRFFVTSRPLDRTVADIERGVIRNLERLDEFSGDALGAPLALIVYPRAYQYSLSESPENWEAHRYEVLGPWVREPFRYFRENGRDLPFPVLSVLPAFEASDEFPLFQRDDPHWTEAGAALMARTVARWAAETGLIPCAAPPPGTRPAAHGPHE
jgi:hypothetical protein